MREFPCRRVSMWSIWYKPENRFVGTSFNAWEDYDTCCEALSQLAPPTYRPQDYEIVKVLVTLERVDDSIETRSEV